MANFTSISLDIGAQLHIIQVVFKKDIGIFIDLSRQEIQISALPIKIWQRLRSGGSMRCEMWQIVIAVRGKKKSLL